MEITVTFRTPQVLPREAAIRYRKNAQGFRKLARTTYERTFSFNGKAEDLTNHTIAAVHEVFDIAREFGLTEFVITKIAAEI